MFNEATFTMMELNAAIAKLKLRKCADEAGLTAELLKDSQLDFQVHLLRQINNVLLGAHVPCSWHAILFVMLAK